MFCEKCGKQVSDTATFCRYCGASTGGEGDAAPTSPAAVPPPAQTGVSPAQTGVNQPPTQAKQTGFYIPRQSGEPGSPQTGYPPAARQQPYAASPGPAQPYGYKGPQPVYPQPGYPQPGSPQTGYQYNAPPRPKKKGGLTAVVVILCVLLAGAAGFIIWIYFGQGKDALASQMSEDLSAEVARYFEDPPSTGTSTYTRDGSGGPDSMDYDEPEGYGNRPQTGESTDYPAGQPSGDTPAPASSQPPAPPPAQGGFSTSAMPDTTQEFAWYTEGYFGDGFPDGYVIIDDWGAITGGWKAALWIDPFRDDYPTSALVMMNINIGGTAGNATVDLRYGNLYDEDGSVVDWSDLDDVYTGGKFEYGELTVGPDYDEFIIYTFYEYRGSQYAVGWNEVTSGVQIFLAMYRP